MQCPKCQFQQPDGHFECMKCGIIFSKFNARKEPAPVAGLATPALATVAAGIAPQAVARATPALATAPAITPRPAARAAVPTLAAPAMATSSMSRAAVVGGVTATAIMPETSPGLFGALPCPQCGMDTTTNTDEDSMKKGQDNFGLVGAMMTYAFTAKYHCPEHGLIENSQFPSAHQKLIYLRKFLIVGAAAAIFVGCFWLIMVLS